MLGVFILLASVCTMVVHFPGQQVQAASNNSDDWSTYLGDNSRTDYNSAETRINASTVRNLKVHWKYSTGGAISTQPLEADGLVYWGSWDGKEYATTLSGKKVWSTFISTPTHDCNHGQLFGVGSTAKIADVVIKGKNTSVAYVGGKHALYALNAVTGAVIWRTVLDTSSAAFIWSSPALYNSSVYIGVASVDACPQVRGALVQLDAATGAIQHTFYVVPKGCLGGGMWSSPTIDDATGTIYIATGNSGFCRTKELYAPAIVKLRASDLSLIDFWRVPGSQQIVDSDFGATPTLFTAPIGNTTRNMVGVVNKNGIFYALNRASLHTGPVWSAEIGTGRVNISSAAWDGRTLYIASRGTTIKGSKCYGSLRAVDPVTGAFIWQHCLNHPVLAAVSLIPGVVFVSTGDDIVAMATATGKTLFDYNVGSAIYGAASISHDAVYVGNTAGTLYVFGL